MPELSVFITITLFWLFEHHSAVVCLSVWFNHVLICALLCRGWLLLPFGERAVRTGMTAVFLEPWKASGGAFGAGDSGSDLASQRGATLRDHHRNNRRC